VHCQFFVFSGNARSEPNPTGADNLRIDTVREENDKGLPKRLVSAQFICHHRPNGFFSSIAVILYREVIQR